MTGQNPKITVLIPTFNRGRFLAECLDSILAQTLPAAQIIVVDDGSTDNTKEICSSYSDAIEYYELNQLGKPSAINCGLEKTVGDYVWIFDDDDVAYPEALERFVEPLENDPQYGFSFSTFNFTSSEPDGRIGAVQFELRIPDLEERGFLIPLLEGNFLGGAAVFARTSCYKEVGYFDPELLRSQDYEMAIRVARCFKGIRIPGGPTFHYRQHEGERGATADRFSVAERGRKWLEYDQKFFRKLYRDLPLSVFLPPRQSLGQERRKAILQRMAIMAYKLLVPEVMEDLKELSVLDGKSPLSSAEYLIIREMMTRVPRHQAGTLYDHAEFFKEIRRLAPSSPAIRSFRKKVFRATLARFRSDPRPEYLPALLHRLMCLFL